jgi:hypothetical protein
MARRSPRSKRSRRRRQLRVSEDTVIMVVIIEPLSNEAEIKEVHMELGGYFTIEQVRDTLMANKDDPDRKNKSVRDLRYKQCKLLM